MSDVSVPRLLGRAVGARLPVVRFLAGLGLDVAALAMLAVFAWGALVPYHYERTGPPIGEVQDARTGVVFEVDDEALAEAFEDRINRSNRILGTLGATLSGAALVLGWRLWRRPWTQRVPTVRRARMVLAATCLSPLAAVAIVVATAAVALPYDWLFGGI